ncbi:MAG: helix-turn-helix transcriptional regulator [Bacteroidota bacterium]
MNDSEFKNAFGKRLEQLRKERKLSYRKMAQMCDIDYSNISKIEKGKINIALSTINELCKALGVEPKELFDFGNQ